MFKFRRNGHSNLADSTHVARELFNMKANIVSLFFTSLLSLQEVEVLITSELTIASQRKICVENKIYN